MKKNYIVIAAIGAIVLAGGAFALSSQSSNKTASNQTTPAQDAAMQKKEAEELAMKKEETAAMKKETAAGGDAMTVAGSYTSYSEAKLANAEKGDVVLFFHAGWCPKCQESDKNFKATGAPDGLTVLKIDYDSSTELRQKYGVNLQHTFVQVDKDGNLIKKWNGSYSYDELKQQVT